MVSCVVSTVVGLVEPRILSCIDRWLVSIKNPGYPVVCRLLISEGSGAIRAFCRACYRVCGDVDEL
jgi:hypothetical protein